jgi:hypothetical protein
MRKRQSMCGGHRGGRRSSRTDALLEESGENGLAWTRLAGFVRRATGRGGDGIVGTYSTCAPDEWQGGHTTQLSCTACRTTRREERSPKLHLDGVSTPWDPLWKRSWTATAATASGITTCRKPARGRTLDVVTKRGRSLQWHIGRRRGRSVEIKERCDGFSKLLDELRIHVFVLVRNVQDMENLC